MYLKRIRLAVVAYMIFFLGVTTWPGVMLVNRVQPLILGLPFNLFFLALIIMGALVLLAALYRAEQSAREQ